jgi:hypothetical protein
MTYSLLDCIGAETSRAYTKFFSTNQKRKTQINSIDGGKNCNTRRGQLPTTLPPGAATTNTTNV